VFIYDDDLLIISKKMSEIDRVKGLLKADFTIHDLGEVKDFLGCQVVRDGERGLISLSCILKHFCFRRDLQSSTAAVVSGPWEKHFHPTTPGHKAHSTFWQQRLAKYTNILRTSLTNGVTISKSY
jgi:hypothetical protein